MIGGLNVASGATLSIMKSQARFGNGCRGQLGAGERMISALMGI